MKPSVTQMFVVGAALLSCVACKRELPGPDECQHLAARILGVENERLLEDPAMKQRFDDLTIKCLTTPFDTELVRCLEESRDARQCLYRFQDRRERGRSKETTSPVRRW